MKRAFSQTTKSMMQKENGVPIAYGKVRLVRTYKQKRKVVQEKATVEDVVFRNCETSIKCPLVLHRAIKRLPSSLRKLSGWKIEGFEAEMILGYAVNKKSVCQILTN